MVEADECDGNFGGAPAEGLLDGFPAGGILEGDVEASDG